jgi:hypothetical protein
MFYPESEFVFQTTQKSDYFINEKSAKSTILTKCFCWNSLVYLASWYDIPPLIVFGQSAKKCIVQFIIKAYTSDFGQIPVLV